MTQTEDEKIYINFLPGHDLPHLVSVGKEHNCNPGWDMVIEVHSVSGCLASSALVKSISMYTKFSKVAPYASLLHESSG